MEDYHKYVDYNNVCRCCLQIPAEEMQEIPPEIKSEIYQVKSINLKYLRIVDYIQNSKHEWNVPLLQFNI